MYGRPDMVQNIFEMYCNIYYIIFIPTGKRPLGRPTRRWEDILK